MSSQDRRIEQLCRRIEKQVGRKVVCGKATQDNDKVVIPVAAAKQRFGNRQSSSYNQPIGLIKVTESTIEFVPIEQRQSLVRSIIKIFILVIGVFGVGHLFKHSKTWNTE